MAYRIDRGTLKPPRMRADGSLVVEGVLTRTGVFLYQNPDGSTRREYRPPTEVFNQDSMATFGLVPVTNDHPGEMVTAENFRDYIIGTTGDTPRQDGEHLVSSIAVFDAKAIADINAGKQELSCGYEVVMEETPGITPEGEKYDAIQRSIRGNHVAIVEIGRAGPQARIRMDALHMVVPAEPTTIPSVRHKDRSHMNLEQALAAIKDLQLEKAQEQIRADQAERALADAKTAADAVQAKLDAAQDKIEKAEAVRADADSKLDAKINEAVALRLTASAILPDEKDEGPARFDGMSPREIKVAVIKQVTDKDMGADKSDAYIDARFDAATESYTADGETLDDARAAGKVAKMDTSPVSKADAAQAAMMERHKNAWKTPQGASN